MQLRDAGAVGGPAAMNWLRPRFAPVAVLAGAVAAVVLIVISALRYPAIFSLPGAAIALTLTGVMLAGYSAWGLRALRHPAAGYQAGLICGVLAGAMWSAEIWSGGPAKLSNPAEKAFGATFALLAVVATITAGVLVATRTGRAGTAWQAGLVSGLASGVVLYAFAVIMTLATLPILASRSDYQAQFAHSHAPDIGVYLVGDILAAAGAHLAINLTLGVLGGGIGALITRAPWGPSPSR